MPDDDATLLRACEAERDTLLALNEALRLALLNTLERLERAEAKPDE